MTRIWGYVHTKPELSLSDLFFPRLKKYLRIHETTKPTQNDVVYMSDQHVAL